jgi:hypothetical protein
MTILKTHPRFVFAATALLWATAACAEPSEADIDRVIRSEFSKADATMFGNRAKEKGMATKVHSVKKLACSAVSARVFVCDVEVDSTNGMLNQRLKQVSSMRLVNASDGWRMSQ